MRPNFCYEEDESLYDDCPSGDYCECYGIGCNDDDDELKKCDDGQIKNINGDCVTCPDGNCDDCGKDQFRDICGNCVNSVISKPTFVQGKCNAIRMMNVMQNETDKEVAGFFTESSKMIIMNNDHPEQSGEKSFNFYSYRNSDGITEWRVFEDSNGQWMINYFDPNNDGAYLSTEKIVAHYHTHPFGGEFSDTDGEFANEHSGIDLYNITGNDINKYNYDGVTETETINCKENPEPNGC